jgi:hypothetical protein
MVQRSPLLIAENIKNNGNTTTAPANISLSEFQGKKFSVKAHTPS